MHTLKQLETKQIGLRLSTHLVEEIDELIEDFNINRTTFIKAAIKNFIQTQKEAKLYDGLDEAMAQVKMMVDGELPKVTLEETINELRNN